MMKRLAIAGLIALASPASAQTVCLWGKPVSLISRMPSGRAGFDALLVERPDGKGPFFVLLERGKALSACP